MPFKHLEEVKTILAASIPLPTQVKTIRKTTAYLTPTYFPIPNTYLDYQDLKPASVKSQPSPLPSPNQFIKAWQEKKIWVVNKNISSAKISQSDNVYQSQNVYNSCYVFNSKDIIFSRQLGSCQRLIASYNNDSCTSSIRLSDSLNSSYCFEVSWSNKVSHSMFIHNGYNLYECFFCQNLYSKKYCIANIQFSPTDYFKLKKQIITYLAKDNWSNLIPLISPARRR